jgi:hypothetical protein
MSLPLNLIIDRTADGKLRAEVAGHPESAVEAADIPGLLNAVRDALFPFVGGGPDEPEQAAPKGNVLDAANPAQDIGRELTEEEDRAMRRMAMERMPDREALKKLVSGHPVPEPWPEGDEDWGDAP